MTEITLAEFHALLLNQGVPTEHLAFRCPICGTIQSGVDLIAAGAGAHFGEVERFLAFSCVGRWRNAGPYKPGTPPGVGCDWTLGGLLRLEKLRVITPDGEKHARFEPVTPQEAQAHMLENQKRAQSAP